MRTAHLFAGVGGGILADLILGHTPVVAVEWDAYACDVLRRQFPGMRVIEGDIRAVDFARELAGVDAICAGFPCQDISSAGRGGGIAGERSGLYREVVRAVDAVRPAFVFLENSPNIRTRGRHVVIGDLVARGYAWRDGVLAASDVGAPHIRKRWWCLAANADGLRQLESGRRERAERGWAGDGVEPVADADLRQRYAQDEALRAGRDAADGRVERDSAGDGVNATGIGRANSGRQEPQQPAHSSLHGDPGCHGPQEPVFGGWVPAADAEAIEAAARFTGARGWNPAHADIRRVVDGIPPWAHRAGARIKGLGNAQIPLQAALAWVLLGGPVEWDALRAAA